MWYASADGGAERKETNDALPGEAVRYPSSDAGARGVGCGARGAGVRTCVGGTSGAGESKGDAENERAVKSVRSDDAQISYPVSLDETRTRALVGGTGLALGVGEKLGVGVGAGVKLPLGVYDALGEAVGV